MTSTSPAPVILCGKRESTARDVIELLKPEFEVIHLIFKSDDGRSQIPLLLSGKGEPSSSNLGSGNYEAKPVAVFTGAAYTEEEVNSMIEACNGDGCKRVPWLRPDINKLAPPPGSAGYGKAMVARIKEAMVDLAEKDQMSGDKIFYY